MNRTAMSNIPAALCYLIGTSIFAIPALAATDDACAQLAARFRSSTGPVTLTAESIEASAAQPWAIPDSGFRPTSPEQRPHVTVPFCRVSGVIKGEADSTIGFEVWLPSRDKWNKKFFGTATGGSAGRVQYDALVTPLSRGYAAMAQDNGHKSTSPYEQSWAYDDATHQVKIQKIVDFAYRAQHLATVVGKEVTRAYYRKSARHSYYVGCSQGGHHGMMEAERYPDDYDGVVAGALASDWISTLSSEAWAATAALRDNRSGALSKLQLGALHAAVMHACDALDGLADGQIDEPRSCHFDPSTLQCGQGGADQGSCLKPQQVAAVRRIYDGLAGTGAAPIALGYSLGSEGGWAGTSNANPPSGSYNDFFRLLVHQDPSWDFLSLDWDKDIGLARQKFGATLNATASNLSAFHKHGGKLIVFHGWADPLIPTAESLRAWNRITDKMGENTTRDFARLFLVPGMGHCQGGPIGSADWLTALEQWVEDNRPPDATSSTYTIVGSGKLDAQTRSRPYCPYPEVERYKGSGDINQAQNFACAKP